MKTFKRIYVNGSSLSCGGSLELDSEAFRHYTINEGISRWSNSKEVSYGNILANLLNIEVINEAKQGGGLDRVIRKTYNYITNTSFSDLEQTLFLLEIPLQPGRMEFYSNQYKDWLVCSVALGPNGESQQVQIRNEGNWWDSKLAFTRGYFRPELRIPYSEYIKHDKLLNEYLTEYYDYQIEAKRMMRELTLFYSYLDSFKLSYIRDASDSMFASSFNTSDKKLRGDFIERLKVNKLNNPNIIESESIWHLNEDKKWRITDEIPSITDAHLGYYGNKKYAEYLLNKIENF